MGSAAGRGSDSSQFVDASTPAPAGLPSPVKVASWSLVAFGLLGLHGFVIIPERERRERVLRDRISELQSETERRERVLRHRISELQSETEELRAKLREAERALFVG